MKRGEAYQAIKRKIRRYCESTLEPSASAANKLIWELNGIVDRVQTDSGPTLPGIKTKALSALLELGLLIRKCISCRSPVADCRCSTQGELYLDVDQRVLVRLLSIE